ncbi:hypothetical protein JL721_4868 [Aureococcus anophagefferens]|nr:hypothetical protein JL721_4868 [Aureococcus anophagefferens]
MLQNLDDFLRILGVLISGFIIIEPDDLATDDARDRFRAFVGAWNDGRLDRMYYDGIPSNVRDRCKRTRHAWNFKLSDEERWNLASTKDSIDGQTRRANPAAIRQLPTAAPTPGAGAGAPRQRLMLSQRDAAETDRLAEQIRARAGARGSRSRPVGLGRSDEARARARRPVSRAQARAAHGG